MSAEFGMRSAEWKTKNRYLKVRIAEWGVKAIETYMNTDRRVQNGELSTWNRVTLKRGLSVLLRK